MSAPQHGSHGSLRKISIREIMDATGFPRAEVLDDAELDHLCDVALSHLGEPSATVVPLTFEDRLRGV